MTMKVMIAKARSAGGEDAAPSEVTTTTATQSIQEYFKAKMAAAAGLF